jgi:hypothetical protein
MRLNLLNLTEIEEEMRNLTARANAMLDDDEEPPTSTFSRNGQTGKRRNAGSRQIN